MKTRFSRGFKPGIKAGIYAVLCSAMCTMAGAAAAQSHSAVELRKDIERHRAMASAHEAAAKCLETKKDHDICLKDLQNACKGLGLGKYCGMKHAH